MQESDCCFHNLEWPAAPARIAGPIVWLRGWIVGKPGHDFIDVRVRHAGRTCLGVLGLPRTDLAAHFQPDRPWLPAEFILGVPVNDGEHGLTLEAMDADGAWHRLREIPLIVAPDGEPPPRVEGRLEEQPGLVCTVRDAHHPFHGHLDQPAVETALIHGRAPVFGWLLDENGPLDRVVATTDGLVFNHLAHSLDDPALAARVTHPGAGRARLRGAVDFPADLTTPACLRVYAVRPDHSVHLCFARRISPLPAAANSTRPGVTVPDIPKCELSVYPSGRPHRLLMVLRSLQPDDSALRALDLTRSLQADHSWAVRIVSTEDGPLRQDFAQAEAESLIVSPDRLLAATDASGAEQALAQLRRQIWWRHLDAVAVFSPVCGWAVTLARAEGIPVLFDCLEDEPVRPDPTASPAVQALLRAGWRAADGVCYGSHAASAAQRESMNGLPGMIIPLWHSPNLPEFAGPVTPRRAMAPLRTADWLRRNAPATFTRWEFVQGPAPVDFDERLHALDDGSNPGLVQHRQDWTTDDIGLVLGPLCGRGPLRPLLDAAAMGIPFAAPATPTTREIFSACHLPWLDNANPMAAAFILSAIDRNPALFERETAYAREQVRTHHSPADLMSRWRSLLSTVAAHRG